MGGDVQLRSTPAVGSVFVVRLPLPEIASAATAMAASPSREVALPDAPLRTVLLIEDDATTREVIATWLRAEGLDVRAADQGMFALHQADAMVDAVTHAAETLPPADRKKAVVLVGNYGEAGAINFLGRGRGAPIAISGHNSYWLWGPDGASSDVLLVLGGDASEHGECGSLQQVGTVECGDCMPYENHKPIWVCRDLPVSFEEIWPGEKHYN